jgi:aspartyl-tRNA(Asn)/glutamyl-tRNA(Gln) amidotransferase subunit C
MSEAVDVDYIAKLSRVELSAEEIAEFQQEIESILSHIEQLSEVDIEGVTNVFGEDVPGDQLPREAVIGNAPDTVDDELIRVPKVINDADQGDH